VSSATELLSPSFSVPQFDAFIEEKVRQTQGRPSFIKVLAQNRDPREAVLNIVDDAWVKDRSLGNIAHDYGTKYHTIFRLLKELEFLKKPLITYILETPRRKRFYVWSLDQSDYDTVQAYIEHAHSAELRKYRNSYNMGNTFGLSWAIAIRAIGHKNRSTVTWQLSKASQELSMILLWPFARSALNCTRQ